MMSSYARKWASISLSTFVFGAPIKRLRVPRGNLVLEIEQLSDMSRVDEWVSYVESYADIMPFVPPPLAELARLPWDGMLALNCPDEGEETRKAIEDLTPSEHEGLHMAFAQALQEAVRYGLQKIVPLSDGSITSESDSSWNGQPAQWDAVAHIFHRTLFSSHNNSHSTLTEKVRNILVYFSQTHFLYGGWADEWLGDEYIRAAFENKIFDFDNILMKWNLLSGSRKIFVFSLKDNSEEEHWHGFSDDFNRVIFAEIAIVEEDGSMHQVGLHRGPHKVTRDDWLENMFSLTAATSLARELGNVTIFYRNNKSSDGVSNFLSTAEIEKELRETQERHYNYILPFLKSKRLTPLQEILESDSGTKIKRFL